MQKEETSKETSSEEAKKIKIGYIFWDRSLGGDEKAFLKLAKKKNAELIMFNIAKGINEAQIEKKVAECDIVFNNSAEDFATELVKTIEEMGKKVVDSSKTYYYSEDKWMFFLKCKRHNIPTPKTALISEDINEAKREILAFNQWPIIIKRIDGCQGDYVEKAENLDEADAIIRKFWKKSSERLPIIIQEFIKSKSYRVTLINNQIVQTATKDADSWKSTGVYQKIHHKFTLDNKIRKLSKRIAKMSGIQVCGIDFLKKDGKWYVIEVNAVPSFDFFPKEREKLISKVLDLLIHKVRNNKHNHRRL